MPKYRHRISQHIIMCELKWHTERSMHPDCQRLLLSPRLGYYINPMQDVKNQMIADFKRKFKRTYLWVLREEANKKFNNPRS